MQRRHPGLLQPARADPLGHPRKRREVRPRSRARPSLSDGRRVTTFKPAQYPSCSSPFRTQHAAIATGQIGSRRTRKFPRRTHHSVSPYRGWSPAARLLSGPRRATTASNKKAVYRCAFFPAASRTDVSHTGNTIRYVLLTSTTNWLKGEAPYRGNLPPPPAGIRRSPGSDGSSCDLPSCSKEKKIDVLQDR